MHRPLLIPPRQRGRFARGVLRTAGILALAWLAQATPGSAAGAPDSSSVAVAAAPDSVLPTLRFRLVLETSFGRFGVGAGEFSGPRGVAIDPLGRILVADAGNHRVERFDSSGVYLDQFGGFGHDEGRFDRPTALWVGGALAVWVLDEGNARIVKYDLAGRLLGVLVSLRSDEIRAALDLIDPTGIATDRGGQIVVADAAGDRVLRFDPLGSILTVRGGFGSQAGRFDRPGGVAVDDYGRILMGDAGNRRVQLLDPFGEALATYALDLGMTGRDGLAVAFGPDSTWALADRATGRVAVRGPGGAVLARHVPKARTDPRISDLAFDGAGRLVASDARGHRVVRFRLEAASP
ncbi:MAG: NHL repeat-containing protein [Candidatus Eisenbacteria bacterium]